LYLWSTATPGLVLILGLNTVIRLFNSNRGYNNNMIAALLPLISDRTIVIKLVGKRIRGIFLLA